MDSQTQPGTRKLGAKEKDVMTTLLLFTAGMLVLPIATYFIVKRVLEDLLSYDNGAVGGAIGCVVVIHIIIAYYIAIAVWEEKSASRPVKTD